MTRTQDPTLETFPKSRRGVNSLRPFDLLLLNLPNLQKEWSVINPRTLRGTSSPIPVRRDPNVMSPIKIGGRRSSYFSNMRLKVSLLNRPEDLHFVFSHFWGDSDLGILKIWEFEQMWLGVQKYLIQCTRVFMTEVDTKRLGLEIRDSNSCLTVRDI